MTTSIRLQRYYFRNAREQRTCQIITQALSPMLTVLLVTILYFYGTLALVPGKTFDHIFYMVFENHAYKEVIANADFANFARDGLLMTNYFATFHPSQPNYIDMIAGTRHGCVDDSVFNIDSISLIDLLEAKSISWKFYQELYPTPGSPTCFTGACSGGSSGCKYARKHNPIMSFRSTQNNSARCQNIVDEAALNADLAAGTLPQYRYEQLIRVNWLLIVSFYTPNQDNQGHDQDINFAGNYLKTFFAGKTFPAKTLIVITFDEDDYSQSNQIYTLVKGDFVPAGTNNIRYNHYSMLRTIEDNWNLGDLGQNDVGATIVTFLAESVPTVPSPPVATPTTFRPTSSSTPTPAPTGTAFPTAPIAPEIVNVTWTFIDGRTRSPSDVTALCRGGLRNTTVFKVREGLKRKRDELQGNDTWTAAIILTDSDTTNSAEGYAYVTH